MAYLACWHMTELPTDIVKIIEKDLKKYDVSAEDSKLTGSQLDTVIRNSKNAWIPTSNWIGGWLWYYINRVNRENFCYDITEIDGCSIQYTQYGPGQFYTWHQDSDIDTFYKPQIIPDSANSMAQDQVSLRGECIRKLSFSLQLSDPTDYTGGEVQFLDNAGKTFFAPKQRGTLIVFDSRTKHRVRKVKSGLRKSLVGWVVGPRWK
jgi:PKHD-type hydroxylase|tara:strand:+ start:1570 stop:2187 length:618 start_codon:yes stop_codon:yes gene_type:complete